MMKILKYPTLLCALLLSSSALTFGEVSPAAQERAAAAFLLVHGRKANPQELAQLQAGAGRPIAEQIKALSESLKKDAQESRSVADKAAWDALGRGAAPSDQGGALNYTQAVKRHVDWLAQHRDEYEKVIHRAYRHVLNRDAYPAEITYWENLGTYSYVMLLGGIDHWARRSSPGLTETAGTPMVSWSSDFLTTVVVSPTVAAEARAAADLENKEETSLAMAAGHNVIAAGSEGLVTGGRMHFVAAGAETPHAH
jgi:hypothetical protein